MDDYKPVKYKYILLVLIVLNMTLPFHALATPEIRIITLSPHLTEWVYELGMGDHLVGVSAFSDVPEDARKHPVVADANGVNFSEVLELQPSIILVWKGGNKPQDVERLSSFGIELFYSSPRTLADIPNELRHLGEKLGNNSLATQKALIFENTIQQIYEEYRNTRPVDVFFYMWTSPLMTIGKDTWTNRLLSYCNASSIFSDSPSDYPEVTVAETLKREPEVLITSLAHTRKALEAFWSPHRHVLKADIVPIDGKIFQRFSLRIQKTLPALCAQIHQSSVN